MRRMHKWLLCIGLSLVVAGLGLLVGSQVAGHLWQNRAQRLVSQIEAVMPQRTAGSEENYRVMDMPALCLEGQDLIGLVEIPAYGVKLPIGNRWQAGKVGRYPSRLEGTVYDGSLIVGGSGRQLACLAQVGHGDAVIVTDLHGAEFRYTVSRIRRTNDADIHSLRSDQVRLVLFMRDVYSMEYVIVECI